MELFSDTCFLLDYLYIYMFWYETLVLTIRIWIVFVMIELLCKLIIMILAYKYKVYTYYDVSHFLHLLYIAACVIPNYTLITWLMGYYINYDLGLIIACIKNDVNLYLFMLQNHYITYDSLVYIIQHNLNQFINALLPIMSQDDLRHFATLAYKYNKAELLRLILPRFTNIQHAMYIIWRSRPYTPYDIIKIFVEHGFDHRFISNAQTAQLLNDGYDIKNKYTYMWCNVRQQRQKSISQTLNALHIKYYDINISNIITSYILYEHIPIEQKRKKVRHRRRRYRG